MITLTTYRCSLNSLLSAYSTETCKAVDAKGAQDDLRALYAYRLDMRGIVMDKVYWPVGDQCHRPTLSVGYTSINTSQQSTTDMSITTRIDDTAISIHRAALTMWHTVQKMSFSHKMFIVFYCDQLLQDIQLVLSESDTLRLWDESKVHVVKIRSRGAAGQNESESMVLDGNASDVRK